MTKSSKKFFRTYVTLGAMLILFVGLISVIMKGLSGGSILDIRSRAAGTTTMSITPSKLTVQPGQIFSVVVQINTNADRVTAADLTIGYDSTKLTALSIENGGFMPVILQPGEIGPNTAHIILGVEPTEPKTGIGQLAIVTFQAGEAIKRGTQITIDRVSKVAALNYETSVLTRTKSASVSIKASR